MARPPRIHAPGLLYHVMARGNHGQQLFFDEQDFRAYLHRVAEIYSTIPFRLYTYVLMSNHIHMLLEVGDEPLSTIMKVLQQRYTQHFNSKYKQFGHVFQGRYKAIICQRETYLLALVRYIHLNPVRSRIVKNPSDYPWSSHRAYLAKKADAWLDREAILMQFGNELKKAQQDYLQFVLAGINEGHRDDYYETRGQQVLGDDEFLESLPLGASAETMKWPKASLEEIAHSVCQALGLDSNQLIERKGKEAHIGRGLMGIIAAEKGHRLKDIARYLQRTPSALNRAIGRVRTLIQTDRALAKLKKDIE